LGWEYILNSTSGLVPRIVYATRSEHGQIPNPAPFSLVAALVAAGTYKELEIREWQVPWEQSRPRDPFVDAQGRVWFVGQVGNYVARLDPGTGQFRRFELEDGALPLEESLAAFERGMALVRVLGDRLDDVSQRVEVLLRTAGGALVTRPLATEEGEEE